MPLNEKYKKNKPRGVKKGTNLGRKPPPHVATAPEKTSKLYRLELSPDDILSYKRQMIERIVNGEARTTSEAARLLNLDPVRAYSWIKADEDFQEALHLAEQVQADELVKELRADKSFIPKMFLLKKIRPEYRDTAKIVQTNDNLEKLLESLTKATKEAKPSPVGDAQTIPTYPALPGYDGTAP